jgi:hypothetical protein
MAKAKYRKGQVLRELAHQVEIRGLDYVYQKHNDPNYKYGDGCLYWYNDQPDCLIGRVLHALDPQTFDGEFFQGKEGVGISGFGEHYGFSINAVLLLTTAQTLQDNGKPYGEVLLKTIQGSL